jgi:hypothetical protein
MELYIKEVVFHAGTRYARAAASSAVHTSEVSAFIDALAPKKGTTFRVSEC